MSNPKVLFWKTEWDLFIATFIIALQKPFLQPLMKPMEAFALHEPEFQDTEAMLLAHGSAYWQWKGRQRNSLDGTYPSEWIATQTFVVPKAPKDGVKLFRLVIDFRNLNEMVEPYHCRNFALLNANFRDGTIQGAHPMGRNPYQRFQTDPRETAECMEYGNRLWSAHASEGEELE